MRRTMVLRKSNRRITKKRLKIKHLRGYKLRRILLDQKRRRVYNSSIVNKQNGAKMTTVTIKAGSYRTKPVHNVSFT